MELTVCICTHDRPRYVRDCLDGLARQTVPRDRFTLLIVDSASAERTELAALAQAHDARLIRLDRPGVSLARNAGAWAARTRYIAYIDDDAIPAPDWIECILAAIARPGRPPALIGGQILPKWEAPLPRWWPASLRGVLSIIEYEGEGEYRSPDVPARLEPYAANMVVNVLSLLAAGGFGAAVGRYGHFAAVGRGGATRLDVAGCRPFGALRFPHRRPSPDPGAPASAGMAAEPALLAGCVNRADAPDAAEPGSGLA